MRPSFSFAVANMSLQEAMVIASYRETAAAAHAHSLSRWLFMVAGLVFVMVVVGGITRLTESGLSITEWKPITGTLPPLSEAQWQAEFLKYQQIPEYIQLKTGMTLAEFKFIYFWEWFHRLLGRLIGLSFALPFAYYIWKRAIPRGYGWRLSGILALGALQGVIGWWMVTSGLSVRTDVSHYRLAVHLLMAFLILYVLIWTALDLHQLARHPASQPARLTGKTTIIIILVAIQLLYGAWVAGLNAGYASDSWPLMNGNFYPQNAGWNGLISLVNDPHLVHFIHRWWAWVAVGALVWLARIDRRAGNRPASIAVHSAFGTQVILGIAVIMTGMNFTLAVLHQAVGASVVATLAWGAHAAGRRR